MLPSHCVTLFTMYSFDQYDTQGIPEVMTLLAERTILTSFFRIGDDVRFPTLIVPWFRVGSDELSFHL